MFAPLTFDQSFRPFLEDLARFDSTKQLEDSTLYRKLKPEFERLLGEVWCEQLAPGLSIGGQRSPLQENIRLIAWNIERGMRLDGVIDCLQKHSSLAGADVLLLSELDWGMARTENRFVAREIARALGMNYAFAPCYIALTKGAGVEKHAKDENRESLHGNALLSRFPMQHVHSLPLPNGKDKMKGAEKRIGSQRAVIADIEHPSGTFRAVSLHLDAHSSQRHRYMQMRRLLDHLERLQPSLPVLIGGDWNTTTHDASRALYSILGYCRRVMMGVRHVVRDHYPYPDRWFERRLFRELERRGFDYRNFNKPGECTLHYNVKDITANLNMGEWVPQWCFWFINWALERTGGSCSMKLDWFTAKDMIAGSSAVAVPHLAVSDHDPIVIDCFNTKSPISRPFRQSASESN
jgi:endonuclease/exonuclease/phosphatase family metal-dependent hydrolase